MRGKNNNPEQASFGAEPLRHVRMGSFELASEFRHLENAPLGEIETCATDSMARIDLATNSMDAPMSSLPGEGPEPSGSPAE